jgi:hypothetical protein
MGAVFERNEFQLGDKFNWPQDEPCRRWTKPSSQAGVVEYSIVMSTTVRSIQISICILALTCIRYLETIGILYTTNTFKLNADCYLYLDHCILPQRINQISKLWLHWNYDKWPAHVTEWTEIWEKLRGMKGLQRLLVDLESNHGGGNCWCGIWAKHIPIQKAKIELEARLDYFEVRWRGQEGGLIFS